MKMQKHSYGWIFTGLAAICCTILICFASGTVQAAPQQEEHIAPIVVEIGNPRLDQTPKSTVDGNDEYAESVQRAASVLRQQFKDREAVAVVELQMATYTDEVGKILISDVFNLAISHTGDPEAGDYIVHQFLGEISGGLSGNYNHDLEKYELTITYSGMEYFTTKEQEEELDGVVKVLLKELKLENATEYEKIKGVYDWLCQNVTYDDENLNDSSYVLKHSAYAAIVNKTAVCQGYATAMYRLLLELGVDVRYVGGTGNGGAHGWNIVKIGQKYYNLDATWDAPCAQNGQPYQYFLKNDEEFTDHTRDNERYGFVNTDSYPMSELSFHNEVFTVVFKDWDGKVLSTQTYRGGDEISKPTNPSRPKDENYIYDFAGWDAPVGKFCTGDQTVTAVYTKTPYFTMEDLLGGAKPTKIELVSFSIVVNTVGQWVESEAGSYYHYNWDNWDELSAISYRVTFSDGVKKIYKGTQFEYKNKQYTLSFADSQSLETPWVVNNTYTVSVSVGDISATTNIDIVYRKGDCNGDGITNNDDVIYLLWSMLFGEEEYPLAYSGDINKDGKLNNADVIYLLWHTLYGAEYPL